MRDIYFTCLCCEARYHKEHHFCNTLCHPEEKGVIHYDFCQKCIQLIVENFEQQMRRKPKLRLEEP